MTKKEPVRASALAREPVEWLWQKRIPRGMVSLVAGTPGVGKSLFGYFLARATAESGEHVIFSTAEESLRKTARARAEAGLQSSASLERVHFWRPELPQDIDQLHAMIVRLHAGLVVIDPVAAHLSVSIYNDQDVRRALTPLADVAEETNAAVLLISHTVKMISARAHPMDAIGGAGGGLRATARMAFLFGKGEEEDEVRLSLVKSNLGRDDIPSFVFDLDVHEFDDGAEAPFLVEVGEGEDSSLEDARVMLKEAGLTKETKEARRAAAAEFLVNFLRAGPMRATEVNAVAVKNGHSERTIRRAAKDLKVVKQKVGGHSMWSLPQDLLDSLDSDGGLGDA
jgi:hypothetical protein